LIHDKQECIGNITWTVSGTVKSIARYTGFSRNGFYPSDLEFNYDAMGNRISKTEMTRNQSTGALNSSDLWNSTFYLRDAKGTIMSIYLLSITGLTASIAQKERDIYGSKLIGIDNTPRELIGVSKTVIGVANANAVDENSVTPIAYTATVSRVMKVSMYAASTSRTKWS